MNALEQALANDMMNTMAAIKGRAVDPLAVLNGDLRRRKAGKRLLLPYKRFSISATGTVGDAIGVPALDDIMGGSGTNSRNFFDNQAADSTEYEDGVLCGFYTTCNLTYFDSAGLCPFGFVESFQKRILDYLEIEVYPTADQREPALHSTKLATFADQLRVINPIPWDDEDATCKLIRNSDETGIVMTAPGVAARTWELTGELTIYGLFLSPEAASAF